jgi:hypothetical protein
MATEAQVILMFRGEAPPAEVLEELLDCDVIEYVTTEVE